jgi:hypothetical protein
MFLESVEKKGRMVRYAFWGSKMANSWYEYALGGDPQLKVMDSFYKRVYGDAELHLELGVFIFDFETC